MRLSDGSEFTLMAYREAQVGCTPDMAKGSARMIAMLNMRAAGNKKKEEKVERTLKSYLLQEAEATSRGAKVAWLRENGVRVMNLQHDGIFVDSLPTGMGLEEVAKKLSEVATQACKYQVVVKGKKGGEWQAGQGTKEGGIRKGIEELRADLYTGEYGGGRGNVQGDGADRTPSGDHVRSGLTDDDGRSNGLGKGRPEGREWGDPRNAG